MNVHNGSHTHWFRFATLLDFFERFVTSYVSLERLGLSGRSELFSVSDIFRFTSRGLTALLACKEYDGLTKISGAPVS